MVTALEEIAHFLHVPAHNVQQKLENPVVKDGVVKHLKENFNLFVDYADKIRYINLHGITFKTASRLTAYNGTNNISEFSVL